MKKVFLMISIGLLLQWNPVTAAIPGETGDCKKEIDAVYKARRSAWLRGDLEGILKSYGPEAVVMPEYHTTLFGKKAIGAYYRQMLDSVKLTRDEHHITEITLIKNYILEIGIFDRNIIWAGKKPYSYTGKYMHIWRKTKGRLSLISETWGSANYLDRSDLPLSGYVSPDTAHIPGPSPGAGLSAIDSINRIFERLIVAGDGLAMAQFYTDDAVYMPYYMPMIRSKAAIGKYYKAHEDPKNGITSVRISVSGLLDLGDFLLENAWYEVRWHNGTQQGVVTGKNSTVWKRDTAGRLLIFRQLVCHD